MKTSSGRTFAKLHLIIACLLLISFAGQLIAMPVYPGLLDKKQPDGTEIQLRMKGDEFAKWYTDQQGYAVVQDQESKSYYYAQKAEDGSLEATTYEVGKTNPASVNLMLDVTPDLSMAIKESAASRSASRSVLKGKSKAPGTGDVRTVKHLVILAYFNDHYDSKSKSVSAAYGRPRVEYDALFNWDVPNLGVDQYNAAPGGSVKDYWSYNSYGKLNIETTVVDWVKLPENEIYYTDYPNDPPDTKYWEMTIDALIRVDAEGVIDFADFDGDGDGFVDALTIVHSGWGAEAGWDPGVHSHAYFQSTSPRWVSSDNTSVGSYNTIPALSGYQPGDTDLIEIGVAVHELGHHVVGLPDLYDVDYSSEGVGHWCVMSGGSWGFPFAETPGGYPTHQPAFPSHLSAPLKELAGFIEPIELNIEDINDPDAFRIGNHELDYFDEVIDALEGVQDMEDAAAFLRILSRKGLLDSPVLSEIEPSALEYHKNLLDILAAIEPETTTDDMSDLGNLVSHMGDQDAMDVERFLYLMDISGLLDITVIDPNNPDLPKDLGALGYVDSDYEFILPGYGVDGGDLVFAGAFGFYYEQYMLSKDDTDPNNVLNDWKFNFQAHISTAILEALPAEFILPDSFDAVDPVSGDPDPIGNVNFEDQDILYVIDFLERLQEHGLLELNILDEYYDPAGTYSFVIKDKAGVAIIEFEGAMAYYFEQYAIAKGTEPVVLNEDPLEYDTSPALDLLADWQTSFIKYILLYDLSTIVPIDPATFDAVIDGDGDPNTDDPIPYPIGNIDFTDKDVIDVTGFLKTLDKLEVLEEVNENSILGTYEEDFELIVEIDDPNIDDIYYTGAMGWFLNEYLVSKGTYPDDRDETPQDILDKWYDKIDIYDGAFHGYSIFEYNLSDPESFDLMGALQDHLASIFWVEPDWEADPFIVNPLDQDMVDLLVLLIVLDDFGLLEMGPLGAYDYKYYNDSYELDPATGYMSHVYGLDGPAGYYLFVYYLAKGIQPEEPEEGQPLIIPAEVILEEYREEFQGFVSELGDYFDDYLLQYYFAYYSGDETAVAELKELWTEALEEYKDTIKVNLGANQILPDPQTTLGWGAYDIGLTALDPNACYKIYLENDNLAVRTQLLNGGDIIPTGSFERNIYRNPAFLRNLKYYNHDYDDIDIYGGIFGPIDEDFDGPAGYIFDSDDIIFDGGSTGTAFFTGGARAGLPFESGIMLSTGNCHQAMGPNKAPNSSTDNGAGVNTVGALFDVILTEDVDEEDFPYVIYNAASVQYTIDKYGLWGGPEISFDAVFASDEYDAIGMETESNRDYYAVIIDDKYVWHGQIILDYDPTVAYPPNIPAEDTPIEQIAEYSSKNAFYVPLVFSKDSNGVSRLVKDYYNTVQYDGGNDPETPRNTFPHVSSSSYLLFNNAKTHSGTPYYKGMYIDPIEGDLAPEKGYNVEFEVFTERIRLQYDIHDLRHLFDSEDAWIDFLNEDFHTIRIVVADLEDKNNISGSHGDTAMFIEAGSMNKAISGWPDECLDERMGEFLLIENRQPVRKFTDTGSNMSPGFEVGLPYGGLAIWHVDYAASVNNIEGYPGQVSANGFEWPWNGYHYAVALLQADGNYDLEKGLNSSDGYDMFRAPDPQGQPQAPEDPVLSNYPILNDFTVPSTKKYHWGCVASTYNSVSDISPAGEQMSFVFMEDGVYNDDFNRPLSINEFADFTSDGLGQWYPGEATYDSLEWWKYNAEGQAKPFDSGEFPGGLPGGHPRRNPDYIPDRYQIFGSTEYADVEWISNTYDPFRWIQGPACSPQDPAGGPYDAYGDSYRTVDMYAVWYEFTAEKTGFVTIETCTAGFDTTIAVYRDPQHVIDMQKHIESDTELGCNDDYPTGSPECAYASYLDFYMEEGESYLIRVGGYNTEQGQFRMTIEYIDPPVNDEPAGAIQLFEDVPQEGRTVGATGTDISSGGDNDFCDLWYAFTPSEYDYYSVKVCDGKADLTIGAYLDPTGNLIPAEFEEEAFNNDCADDPRQTCLDCVANFPEDERFNTFDGTDDPQISVLMEPGLTYYIRVAGSQDSFGEFIIELTRRPEGDDCERAKTATDYNILGMLYQGTTASSRPSIAADYPGVVMPGTSVKSGDDAVVDLFDTVEATSKKDKITSSYAQRSNTVQANVLALEKALRTSDTVKIRLDLFEDTTLTCIQSKLVRKGDYRFIWIGEVEGVANSMVIISVIDGTISGSALSGGREYSFGTSNGNVIISEVGNLPFTNPVVIPDTTGKTFAPMSESKVSLPDGGEVCDVMIVYTPAALDLAGSVVDIDTIIDIFIATANEVYENSNVNLELRLAHSALVNYDGDAVYDEGDDYLFDLAIGAIPSVHDLRDGYGADLVCMLTDLQFDTDPYVGPGYAGVAYLMPEFSLDSEYLGYSVVGMPTPELISSIALTFAHELGHNMGCGHAVEQYMQKGPGIFEYSSGWYVEAATECTIMAYPDIDGDGYSDYARIPYFSNPEIDLGYGPIGDAETADNARTINETRFAVCNYRRSSAIESIEIVGESVVEEGGTVTLDCEAKFTIGDPIDITDLCEWEVIDGDGPGFVDATGLFDPNGQYGTTIVTATYLKGLPGELVDTHAVTVVPAMLRSYCGSTPASDDIYDVYDVWYKYTPRYDADVTVSLAGSSFDTVLNVFDACGGNILACNDDMSSFSRASELTMYMEGGKRYLIRISGYGGETGAYTLRVTGGEGDGVDILELPGGEEKIIIDGQAVDMEIYAIGGEPPYTDWSIAAKGGEAEGFKPQVGSLYGQLIATSPLPGGSQDEDDAFYDYTLPFAEGFPFFGNTYTDIRICTNGFIDLSGSATFMPDNGQTTIEMEELLVANTVIAPMWDDLTLEDDQDLTNNIEVGVGSDHVVIKWIAKQVINGNPCAFAVQLFENGEIQFHYSDGSVNENVTPTVGISSGSDTIGYIMYGPYSSDTAIDLNNVDSLRYFDDSFNASMLPTGLDKSISADGISIFGTINRSLAPVGADLDEYPVRISVKDSGSPQRSVDKVFTFKYVDSLEMDILEQIALNWLIGECQFDNDWCDQADLNGDGIVDVNDIGVLGLGWAVSAPAN